MDHGPVFKMLVNFYDRDPTFIDRPFFMIVVQLFKIPGAFYHFRSTPIFMLARVFSILDSF